MKGTLMFVLHSHIPYVKKKGKFPFGEEWLFEAIIDSYLPILDALTKLKQKGTKASITIGLTPVLLKQLEDSYLIGEFIKYLKQRITFAKNDFLKFKENSQPALAELAKNYGFQYEYLLNLFSHQFEKDLITPFKELQKQGMIEIITSAASHGYLPLFKKDQSVRLQLEVGKRIYQDHFNQDPVGIWLPECAYKPGLDRLLKEYGFKYFITDTHAIIGGKPTNISSYGRELSAPFEPLRPYTTFKPYALRSGVNVLGRNKTTGGQVWSANLGYPGEGSYREFHKRDQDTGLQYWQVCGKNVPLSEKEIYNSQIANNKVIEHANHFCSLVEQLLANYYAKSGEEGIILTPYDTELFGHWWYEGVNWLTKVIELLQDNKVVRLSTVKGYLKDHQPQGFIDLPESSWGAGGKHDVWLNEETRWIWEILHQAEDLFWAREPITPSWEDPLVQEFLLLQSSDWPFLITTGQAKEYAIKRVNEHNLKLHELLER